MMEERELDEMRRMQGKDPAKEKLAWMYAPVGVQNDADEYLMGKVKEPEQEDEELKKLVTAKGVGSNFIKDGGKWGFAFVTRADSANEACRQMLQITQ